MMMGRIDVDHTWVTDEEHFLTEMEKRERYKWYQMEKPAQDRDVAGGLYALLWRK